MQELLRELAPPPRRGRRWMIATFAVGGGLVVAAIALRERPTRRDVLGVRRMPALSLLWARVSHGRPPLPYLVWPAFAARGVFLLVPFVSSAWSFVGLVVARDFFGAAVGPAHAASSSESIRALSVPAPSAWCAWRAPCWGSGLPCRGPALRSSRLPLDLRRGGPSRHGREPPSAAARRAQPETVGGEAPAGLRDAWATVRDDHAFRRSWSRRFCSASVAGSRRPRIRSCSSTCSR